MRKQKVIFLSYSFMGYEKEVINLLEDVMGFEVYFINSKEYEYEYKNIFEKISNNIFYKPFKKNLKDIKFNSGIINEIDKIGEVDFYFCIRADKFSSEIFDYIKSKGKPMILHHWDSFSFIKEQQKYLKYFDKISSFDKLESEKFGMKFIPNFYLKKNIVVTDEEKIEYEFFTVMKYDGRFELLESLAKFLKEKNISYKFIVVATQELESEYVEISKEYISLEKNYEYLSKSRGIVEIGHTEELSDLYQGGASFRIADAVGNRKKIITNYEFIKNYDIYSEKDIGIISLKNIELDDKFLENHEINYSEESYNSYSGDSWIKKIFEGMKV